MRPNRIRHALKQLGGALAALLLQLLFAHPVAADHHVQYEDVTPVDDTEPAPTTDTAPARIAPSPAADQEKSPQRSAELRSVEGALGRNMAWEYDFYLAMIENQSIHADGFAGYLRGKYESKRIGGIVMAGVVAPIIATLTILGTVQIYRHGVRDDGGFCNHVHYDEVDDEYDTDCEGDRGEVAGIVTLSSIGGLVALGVLIPGLVNIARNSKRIRRLAPLTTRADARRSKVKFGCAVSPRDVSLRLLF